MNDYLLRIENLYKYYGDRCILNDIDFKRIGSAPLVVRIILVLLVCVIVGVAGYFLSTTKQLETLQKVQNEESALRQTFVEKQSKAANLDAYKQQLEEMRISFGTLLRQLPNRTEIETLLTDISQTGISSGLDIEFFKPEGLAPKEFYAEYPIKLKVTGRYHEFAEFVSGSRRSFVVEDGRGEEERGREESGAAGAGRHVVRRSRTSGGSMRGEGTPLPDATRILPRPNGALSARARVPRP